MQITILGASGKVGRRVVELALQRGYTVVAVVNRHDPFSGTPNLLVRKADVHDAAAMAQVLQGSDAVISTLGSWGTPGHDILVSAMQAVIPAMEQQKITRIITLTGVGVADPSQPLTRGKALFLKLLAPFPVGKVFRDGEQHLRLLADSTLDWTAICSPVMNNFGKGSYILNDKTGNPLGTITRQAVATSLLDELEHNDHPYKTAVIHRA